MLFLCDKSAGFVTAVSATKRSF